MPPESGTIAPEAPAENSDDNFNDSGSVSAVNKYTPGNAPDVEEAVAALPEDNEEAITPAKPSSSQAFKSTQFPIHPPSFFTNERGNLKVVAFVIRKPCAIFSFLIALCFIIAFLLQVLVFRASETGGFTLPSNEFDVNDVRSMQYDSYRLAKDQVQATRKVLEQGSKVTLRQSETAAIAMWVFESEEGNDAGVFGSADSISGMKEAFDIFMADPNFVDYCLVDYSKTVGVNETQPCRQPLTPLSMYYASEWDEAKVASVITQLSDSERVDQFNTLAQCYIQGLYCENVSNATSLEDIAWAVGLGANISSIVSKWDMEGEMVQNFQQVTELASYLKQVDVFRGAVDYGFDTGFSVANPVSHYSRGIVFWGGPLEDRNQTITNGEVNEEVKDSERDMRKEYIKANYLAKMEKQSEKGTHGALNSYYFMTAIVGDVILGIVTKDALLALFSLAFVFF